MRRSPIWVACILLMVVAIPVARDVISADGGEHGQPMQLLPAAVEPYSADDAQCDNARPEIEDKTSASGGVEDTAKETDEETIDESLAGAIEDCMSNPVGSAGRQMDNALGFYSPGDSRISRGGALGTGSAGGAHLIQPRDGGGELGPDAAGLTVLGDLPGELVGEVESVWGIDDSLTSPTTGTSGSAPQPIGILAPDERVQLIGEPHASVPTGNAYTPGLALIQPSIAELDVEATALDPVVVGTPAPALVPEPGSIVVWTLLGLVVAGYGWRRR